MGASAVSTESPRNNLAWRVSVLEREVSTLKEGKPDVIAERVATLTRAFADHKREVHDDINNVRAENTKSNGEVRDDLKGVRRILLGFLSGVTLVVLAAVLTIVLSQ